MGVGEFSPFSDPVPCPSSWIGQGAFPVLFVIFVMVRSASSPLSLAGAFPRHRAGLKSWLHVLIVFPQNITSGLLQSAGV